MKKTTFYKPDSASSLSSSWCSWRKHVWANVTRLGGGPNQNDEMSASFSKAWGFVSLFFFVVRIGPAGGPLQNAKQSKLTTNTGQKKGMSKIYCSVLSTKLHLIPRARLGPALGPTITWNLHTLSQCWLLNFLWSQSSKQILFWMHMPTMPCWERILSLPARLVQTPSNLGQWLKLIFGGYLFCLRMIILINWLDIFQPQNDVGRLATPAGVCLAAPPMYENCPTCAYQRLQ